MGIRNGHVAVCLILLCLAGEENIGDWSFFGDAALEFEPAGESVSDH